MEKLQSSDSTELSENTSMKRFASIDFLRGNEGINKKNTAALVLSIIGLVITVAFFVFTFIATPASLNFYL